MSAPTTSTPTSAPVPPGLAGVEGTSSTIAPPDRTLATLTVAFAADPVMRWFFPDATRYLASFPELAWLLGQDAFAGGAVDQAPGGIGVALWVSPGTELPEDDLAGLLVRSVDPDRHEVAFAFLTQVEEHRLADPHWYLPVIGVEPREQGRGHGSALLRDGLARCDRDGLPAYLEASSARNRELYARHGFETLAEIQAGDSPPLWPMVRAPR
jgi:ribosomal protein S18 acetylase RimI-like enzyme